MLQPCSPATLVAEILRRELSTSISSYTYIDFCAGAGGPTPHIERALNQQLDTTSSTTTTATTTSRPRPSYAAVASQDHTYNAPTPPNPNGKVNGEQNEPVKFVLTDLHPHVESWEKAALASPHLTYVSTPVDAAAAPAELFANRGKKPVFRLFNLAFHHFDDGLARAILKNTVETSHGFAIFELQSRDIPSFISCLLFGFFIFLIAPLLYWWSPQILFFVYVVPIVPFVLVYDGLVSSLRTRTADEVELLLRTCGAGNTVDWVVRSGSERFLWPCGHLKWIICARKGDGDDDGM